MEIRLLAQPSQGPEATATTTTPCIEKRCSDDSTSKTDGVCARSLSGCVTNGRGCIEATADCDQYLGT